MRDYDKSLKNVQQAIQNLENKKDSYSNEEYIMHKQNLINIYANTLDRKQTQDDIYGSITNEKDKTKYDICDAIDRGVVTKEQLPQFIDNFNQFFTMNDEVVDNRTISMGGKLYNKIITFAKANNINFNTLGIIHNAGNNEFVIPKNQKSYIEFAKLYHKAAVEDSFLGGVGAMFLNTADELFGSDGKINDGMSLNYVGGLSKYYTSQKKNIEEKYGITEYYMPIVSPTTIDLNYGINYVSGEKSSELNVVNKNLTDRLLQSNLLNYKIYANEDDVKNDNGGVNPMNEITDPKVKQEIMNAIFRGSGDNKKTDKSITGDLTYDFATSGYSYGTVIKIPKGDGFYEVYIEKLLPSEESEQYIMSDKFKASAYIEVMNAKAKAGRTYTNNLGSDYSGSFKGYGDDIFTYKLSNSKKEISLSKEEAILLKQYSDVFNKLCITNGLSNDGNGTYSEEEISKFIKYTDNIDKISFIDILCKISDNTPELVEHQLLDMYRTYYKK